MKDIRFGKRTRIIHQDDGSVKYVQESWYDSQLKGVNCWVFQEPVLLRDKNHALSEIMKSLELISNQETNKVTFEVEADPKTHEFKLITRQYEVME